ncbi:MAG: bifunctional metallophosphatase/5'-nucleotidase [Clostridia bacterium]|nr:bifunctional metallophosphatase/5'-nucleotidase [Clostridia bacterium]
MKKFFALLLCLILMLGLCMPISAASEDVVTVLFTHDLHSHFLPVGTDSGGESGGYARLYTLMEEERNKAEGAVITLDGGDFSMGSLFQTIYATDAAELRILAKLGVDATTFGNHEFDFRQIGLVNMLNSAVASGDELPPLVCGNFYPPTDGTAQDAWDAYNNYGVKDYVMIEKEGVRFAVFGLMGVDAHSNAPMSGMDFKDPIETAERIVKEIKEKEDYDYIICLSHSGTETDEEKSEDFQLASAVDGIDVIVSGHTHTTLREPIHVNNTWIVSCGSYAKNLGVLKIKGEHGNTELVSYELKKVSEKVKDNEEIAAIVEDYKTLVTENYLAEYGLTFDDVLAVSSFNFDSVGGAQEDKAIGNFIADAYRYAVESIEGDNAEDRITFTVIASGVVRGSFTEGEITTSEVFDIDSLGVGADGKSGYPLVSVYLTGKDLKTALEVDASVVPLMSAAQLYGSGVYWKYNTSRMIFNKVVETGVIMDDGSIVPIEDDQLYRVVTGLYCCQMLSAVEDKSFGLLSITPRHKDGTPVTDYDSLIIHDQNDNEIKEWYALAMYLQSFEKNEDGISVVPEFYSQPEARKVVYASTNLYELLRNANMFTWILIIVVLVVVAIVALIVILVTKKILRKKRKNTAN